MIRILFYRPSNYSPITLPLSFFACRQIIQSVSKNYHSTTHRYNKEHYNSRAYELIPDPHLIENVTRNGKAEKSINDWNDFYYQLKKKNEDLKAKEKTAK